MAVVEKKNGAVRICIDPQPLNKALKREHYKMPILDDLLPELQSSRLFSKLDVREAFYHVKLDEKSADLTTMITPFGRYRWKRLPFGLSVSSEIFQRRLNEALKGLHGCINVADDIIIHGRSVEEHDRNMKELTARCNERKILLNEGKACLKRTEIDFLGHVIGANGVKPDPNKVKATLDMPAPEDVAGVRRFCGIIQYLARFIPNLSKSAEPLRALTRKDIEFKWSRDCQDKFLELKEKVAKATTLKYFDPSEPLSLQVDSSVDGMGAVLLQKGMPIEYASRSLTKTQQKWVAVVFGLERFHQYTYGRPISIENDHKPMEMILNKPLRHPRDYKI
ncbi:polyprotein [Elysia marginata]|uniref:Polyprotein n=1 Tax=Elysia marginata TaxID=1093978 RepID=A0AAV4JEK4_9GAST|nr:polyprotein [Elysia marginata]